MSFKNLMLIEPILKAISEQGYQQPTPIQEQTIPHVLEGRDILGCAQTGTGKTAAFSIPIIQLLSQKKSASEAHAIKALILTPTRELAIQVSENIRTYTRYLHLKHLTIFGGVPKFDQIRKLRQGTDILVATPGRLLDLVQQRHVSLNKVEFFVLDEADHMLDIGFIHDIRKIISLLPARRQTLFFSATMPPAVMQLVSSLLKNPVKIQVTPSNTTAELIQQSVYHVDKHNKRSLLLHLLKQEEMENAILFTRTKHGADKIARAINAAGTRAEAIHGDKSQVSRQRALMNFTARRTKVLVATDIAARGIDIRGMSHVINFDLPETPETYVHRIGRTGRAGTEGKAISFCGDEERAHLRDIQRLIKKVIPIVKDHPYDVPYKYGREQSIDSILAPTPSPKTFPAKRKGRTFMQRSF